jgi:UDP-N-acetylmuramoyl-tripeptide--D-alanyl-D-alanine ligase
MVLHALLSDVVGPLAAQWTAAAQALADRPVTGISTDTRNLEPGNVFVALRGDQFDGHHFVERALHQGAIAAVVADPPVAADWPCVQVADTLAAYQHLGRWWRQRLGVPIVAITGSVGKTTTKELIAAALATHGPVLKTQANYNNEIGVPKTLLALRAEHQFGVVEMGMRGPGEIALLTDIAQPDVAVITNVGTAHIGRLGSEQAIADAKCELLAHLPPGGIAVLNHDNERLMTTAAGVWSGRCLTFGLTGGDIHGQLLDEKTLLVAGQRLPLPLVGRHHALNYLAAIAVMTALNLDWQRLQGGLQVSLPQGRGRRLSLPDDRVILDETYNAGVESMEAALALLGQTPGQRRIAVLGTMKELGDHSVILHRRVGETARRCGIDQVLILAEPDAAQAMAAGAAPLPTIAFDQADALVTHLQKTMRAGDRLLFKASRAVALDQVIARLLENPALA